MYKLTLTKAERDAIDWVGNRYSNGYDLFKQLMNCEFEHDWDFAGDIEFSISEHVAWEIQNIAQEERYLWPCFSVAFAAKMDKFVDSIV